MTPLHDILARRIAATGPISLADYMSECLLHPDHGYYTRAEPFGAAGDFITAPEISQMFGELLGLWVAQSWLDQGSPAFTLAELGPGRGTLMADVLRATRTVPGFHTAAAVTLVEASPRLRDLQRATLGNHPVTWADSADTLPDAPLFLLANEFFDALPIRQFTRHARGWAETMVGLDAGRLTLGRSAPVNLASLSHRLADTAPGDVVETCPAAAPVMDAIARRIARNGGAALVIDYGGWRSRGDTFQALRGHRFTDPLAAPGTADLTAHVDFEPLAAAATAAGARAHGPVGQGELLERLGLTHRARVLAARLTGAALDSHVKAHHRLTHPTEMGTLFQALAVTPPDAPLPAGFAS